MQTAHLKQRCEVRLKPDSDWMKVNAEQSPQILPCRCEIILYAFGRDKYEDGRGHMLIKLFSLIPVVDAKGKEMDQGALLRYLGEIVWVPSAALSDYITWE